MRDKIFRVMKWYDDLREDLRFLAFMLFVMVPWAALFTFNNFLGIMWIVAIAMARICFLNEMAHPPRHEETKKEK